MKVAVIGAGISGVTTAYMLAARGCQVTLIDRADTVAEETSHANGSVVGGTQIEPWATPGLQWQLLKWIGREDAPLLVRWQQLPRIAGWGARFLRNCGHRQFMRNLQTSGRLTRHSLKVFAQLRSDGAVAAQDYALNTHGALKLYQSVAAFEQACTEAETIAALGFDARPVDPDECVAREPGLAPVAATLAGGVLYVDEEIGNCRAFARRLAERLEAQGAELKLRSAVERIERDGDRVTSLGTAEGPIHADAYVVAAASYSAPLLATAGIRAPVIPIKGVTITVPAEPWADAVQGAVMDHSRLFGLIRIGGDLRASGSAEITGYDTRPSAARCDAIIRNVLELFPDFLRCLDTAEQRRWAGVRGNSPDGPPILGATRLRNLFLNIGHGPQGWSTSCGCADLVADCVTGATPAIDMDGLTLARFGG